MSWSESLIKLATYEVETHQKRLADIVERRTAAQMRLAALHAEGDAERARSQDDANVGLYQNGYLDGLRQRKAAMRVEIDTLLIEERGARDALSAAFEEQKKYEHVAEQARRVEVKEAARRETAALDELGLRRARG